MSVNLAPELVIDPRFDQEVFADGAVLEGHRVNIDCGRLQQTLAMERVPTARLHRLDILVATDDILDDTSYPTQIDSGYWVTTGISPSRADPLSIPALKRTHDPAATLEHALNARLLGSIGHIEDLEKEARLEDKDLSTWERDQHIVTVVLSGYAAVVTTLVTSEIPIGSFDRFATSTSVGVLVATKARKTFTEARQNSKVQANEQNKNTDQTGKKFVPKILQIVSVK